MASALSRFFRLGTPLAATLCAAGYVEWWLVLVPVIPVWWSFATGTRKAHERARIIRHPQREMSLAEAAAERRYRDANTALLDAAVDRNTAIRELATARAIDHDRAE
jgi:hypothetical protein